MSEFSFTFYHIINKKKENGFEPIFKEFKNQINIYQRQFDLTLKSYLKEWKDELKKNDVEYKTRKDAAEKIYEAEIKDYKEDEYAHNYAMNASGLEIIEEEHYTQKEEINTEYKNFLDLYSKSILIALYSLNESKLNEIIETSSVIFNKKIKPSHFNSRDYLNSSILYLNLVIEIEMKTIDKYVSSLKEIQFLRNNIIHNASILTEVKTASNIAKKYERLLSYNEKTGFLKIISSKCIKDFFVLLKDFYEELFWLIDIKQELTIIKNGLTYWLGMINQEMSIESANFEKFTNKEKLLYFKAISKNKEIKDFECKITLIRTSDGTFEFINQIEDEKINNFLEYEKKLNGSYLNDVFEPFNMNSSNYKKKILIY